MLFKCCYQFMENIKINNYFLAINVHFENILISTSEYFAESYFRL